jgi:hypothetical protein
VEFAILGDFAMGRQEALDRLRNRSLRRRDCSRARFPDELNEMLLVQLGVELSCTLREPTVSNLAAPGFQ